MKEGFTKMDKNFQKVVNSLDNMHNELNEFQTATTKMLRTLITGKCVAPKYLYFHEKKSGWKDLSKLFNKQVEVFFICPITMSIPKDANGNFCSYMVKLPAQWIQKYGPAIVLSLKVMKVACAIGRLAGLPLPVISDIPSQGNGWISKSTKSLTAMYNTLSEDKDLAPVTSFIDKKYNSVVAVGTEAIENAESGEVHEEPSCKLIQKSYNEIKSLADTFNKPDPGFHRSGLVLAIDKQGNSEYVHRDFKDVYEEHGFEACIKMNLT